MAFRLGPFAAGFSKFAGGVMEANEKKKAEQMMLEDRLAQKEMRDLQKRSLEQALERPATPDKWDKIETPDGYVEINERTREVRPIQMEGQRVRGVPRAEPLEVVLGQGGKPTFTPRSQAIGREAPRTPEPLVQVATPEGGATYVPRSEAVGAQAPVPAAASGAADKRKRGEALANVTAALDSFEQSLRTTGAQVVPSAEKDALQTNYENLQLQLKELFNLGVLNGPDLELMRRIIQDPTSIRGRALSFGSGDEQTKRVLTQIETMRGKLGSFRAAAGVASPEVPDHSALSDEEFAKRWAAGAYKKP